MARYHYRNGVTLDKKKNRWFIILIGIIVVLLAFYVTAVYLAPQLVTVPFTNLTAEATGNKIKNSKAGQFGDRLFLPQINVEVAIASGGGSDALSRGAWQRNAALGDPAKGGHFVLSAPQFTLDTTPWYTRQKSPFYNLGKLRDGDQITVDYKGTRYTYEVDKTFAVGGTAPEQKSDDDRLTLYATDNTGKPVNGPAVSAKLISPQTQASSGFGG